MEERDLSAFFESGKEKVGWGEEEEEEERRGIPGRGGEKERWEGAVAIRKSLQENVGSSNHGAAIYNAYQVTLHFS